LLRPQGARRGPAGRHAGVLDGGRGALAPRARRAQRRPRRAHRAARRRDSRCPPRGGEARRHRAGLRRRADRRAHRARQPPARRAPLRARGLGGGGPPRRRGRRAGGAPREPEDPARGAPAGHGGGARRRTGHEGSRGPHDIDALAWAAGALIILGASFVMGLAGFGIGLVPPAFLPYLMAPAEAIVLMTLYAATFALAIFVPVRDSFAPARVVDLVIGTV